jgi:hypothetical protein
MYWRDGLHVEIVASVVGSGEGKPLMNSSFLRFP